MRGCSICVLTAVMLMAPAARALAQVTHIATFENFIAGDNWPSSFIDPVSGFQFRNSTHPRGGGFVINHSATLFGDSLYLAAGAGPEGAVGNRFGFTADLPSPARQIGLDVIYFGDLSTHIEIHGFNALGLEVASAVGPLGNSTSPFRLEMDSPQFDIVTFRVSVGTTGQAAYDNIAFTTVPEPESPWSLLLVPLAIADSFRNQLRCRNKTLPRFQSA